jgi:hypothetical protein
LAFSELHQQQYAQRHNERCNLPKHHPALLRSILFNSRLYSTRGARKRSHGGRRSSFRPLSTRDVVYLPAQRARVATIILRIRSPFL